MMNKKGAEMTIGTIVVIILALVVLVVLIYGFSTGWSNLWQNIIGFGGGTVNVQTVVDSCKLACTTQGTFDYCSKPRTVNAPGADGKVKTVSTTCDKLKTGGSFPVVNSPTDTISIAAQDMGECNINCNAGADECQKAQTTACTDANNAAIAKCSVSWMTLIEQNNAKRDMGTGKTYKEVSTVTTVANNNQGQLCTKVILN